MSHYFRFPRYLLLVLACTLASSIARADPVEVSYVVSGHTGAWLLDFSVTNNLGGTNNVYFFGVQFRRQVMLLVLPIIGTQVGIRQLIMETHDPII